MVGDEGGRRGAPPGVKAGYGAAAQGWDDGPGRMYAPLARALVAAALPFRDHAFDVVLAAFCLNHLADPAAGLAQARRVGAALAASVFAPGWSHPAKDAVDEVLRAFGYRPPAWYGSLMPGSRVSDLAGYAGVRTRTITVPTGVDGPAELAAWRLGMAHVAPFLRSLDAPVRAEVRRAAENAVAGTGPLVVAMAVLTAG